MTSARSNRPRPPRTAARGDRAPAAGAGPPAEPVRARPAERGETERVFREGGVPLTPQRRAVLEALRGRRDHPTADHLLEDVRRRLPGTSRTTVYRGLETLVELGLAARIGHPGAAARYDARTDRHHHLVCERCGGVLDVDAPELDALEVPPRLARELRLRDWSVLLRGVCPACARREG